MEEITIKLDMPPEFEEEFKRELAKSIKELVNNIEFSIAKKIISKSQLTEKDAEEFSEKVKKSMHDDLVERGLV